MRKNFALCVGINNYPGLASDLGGCVNDAFDWAELLRGQGYEVEMVLDSDATRDRILTALAHTIAKAGYGDRVVFTYSGHGSWVPDRDGDEADGRDEVLCAYDYEKGGLVTDDDLAIAFSRAARGVGSLILSDSCHSGTVSRFVALTGTVTPTGTPRFIPPTSFMDMSPERAVQLEAVSAGSSRTPASLISGCADTEYSYDAWFTHANGAFTRAAIDTWKPGITLNTWFRAIRRILPNSNYPQTPQLSTTSYRKYVRAL